MLKIKDIKPGVILKVTGKNFQKKITDVEFPKSGDIVLIFKTEDGREHKLNKKMQEIFEAKNEILEVTDV